MQRSIAICAINGSPPGAPKKTARDIKLSRVLNCADSGTKKDAREHLSPKPANVPAKKLGPGTAALRGPQPPGYIRPDGYGFDIGIAGAAVSATIFGASATTKSFLLNTAQVLDHVQYSTADNLL